MEKQDNSIILNQINGINIQSSGSVRQNDLLLKDSDWKYSQEKCATWCKKRSVLQEPYENISCNFNTDTGICSIRDLNRCANCNGCCFLNYEPNNVLMISPENLDIQSPFLGAASDFPSDVSIFQANIKLIPIPVHHRLNHD